jgi:serine phosphatase RsbU (regulator of sigma subunit)
VDRVLRIVKASGGKSAKVILENVLRDLDKFAGGAPQEDDITAVLIKRRLG